MYLTYDEYKEYGGTLDETAFAALEFQSRKRIDYLTNNRVHCMEKAGMVPEAVKRCVFALVDLESKVGTVAQVNDPTVTSFTNDGYSEHFGNLPNATEASAQMSALIGQYLFGEVDLCGVPLLYRGVRG